MAHEDGSRERLDKTLVQSRLESSFPPMDLPERFRHGDDGQEDVTAPKGKNAGQYLHQSIFSIIPAFAGRGQSNFQSRFDDDPSESEEDRAEQLAPRSHGGDGTEEGESESSRRRASLLRFTPRLRPGWRQSEQDEAAAERMSSSQILPPRQNWSGEQAEAGEQLGKHDEKNEESGPASYAPVLSRMLIAEAEMEASTQAAESSRTREDSSEGKSKSKRPVSLAERLQQIFEFDEPEDVVTEFPCWFLQTVLLQGYLYITQKHVCFYAYLPKRDSEVSKSGHLSKRQRSRPKALYRRVFFELRGDYLTYYTDASKKIFPYGHIDLRYAISASVAPAKEQGKEGIEFKVSTDQKNYHFRADSAESAKGWVKQVQRVIFRSSNDSDSVKISVLIDNIIGIEANQTLDFADTVKIQVIDNNETFAVDDYLFSFFSRGQEAYSALMTVVDNKQLQAPVEQKARHSPERPGKTLGSSDLRTPVVQESLRETVGSTDVQHSFGDRGQFRDRGNREDFQASGPRTSGSKADDHHVPHSPSSSKPQGSSDSVSQSLAHDTESSAAVQSLDDTNASASQMLVQSTLFRTPTMHRLERSASTSSGESRRRGSEDTAKSLEVSKEHEPKDTKSSQPHRSNVTSLEGAETPNELLAEPSAYKMTQSSAARSYALRDLVRAGTNPLQTASGVAEYLTKRSKDMSSLLATESMGYYEKVSGMWAGKRKHYGASPGLAPGDEVAEEDDEATTANDAERFRKYFALSEKEQLKAIYFASIQRVLPLYGKIYVSDRHFCFRSLLPGTRFRVVLPFEDIENVNKERGYRPGHPGVVIVIRGFEELFFEFSRKDDRDDCVVTLLQSLERTRYVQDTGNQELDQTSDAEAARIEHHLLQEARQDGQVEQDADLSGDSTVRKEDPDAPPVLFDDPRASILNFKPTKSLHITCLTIGSRGDVQPYLALCRALNAEGHRTCIATHVEFKGWIESYGVDFAPVEGDPAELMRLCIENGMFTYNFMREATTKFRVWLDGLLITAWNACKGTELLIESPSAMAGIHIAEALEIPYMRAFSMPWTRTRAYPHAFAVPEHRMGGYYNYMTYVMFERFFWKAIAGQVNSWRKKELGLGSTNYDMMQTNKVPFLYFYSPTVVPPPADYSEWIKITGYWFLDSSPSYVPNPDIVNFIAQARKDGKKIVYIGFGSIVVEDPAALTQTIVDSVLKADVRCILAKGWSDRLDRGADATKPEVPLPPDILSITGAPHDWLFQQIDAVVHHGGCGTTGASLRAGVPTVIKPFFGDQYFFGARVDALGVGFCLYKINTRVLAKALWEATHSQRMQRRARALGEQIRKEDGVSAAIQTIYRDLEYAATLSRLRNKRNGDGAVDDVFEETWTFVGDETNEPVS